MQIVLMHHVSLPVVDLERAKRFYLEIIGLQEIERPPFDFEGAWFRVGGNQQLHLIKSSHATFRAGNIDSRDTHFALRADSFTKALPFLESRGYSETAAPDDLMAMKVSRKPTAGFPQIYILDPDRNVIEINAATLDANA